MKVNDEENGDEVGRATEDWRVYLNEHEDGSLAECACASICMFVD